MLGGGGGGGGCMVKPMSFQRVKKTIDFCQNGLLKLVSCFYYYCRYLDENKNKLSICNKEFADLMNYHIIILDNTPS